MGTAPTGPPQVTLGGARGDMAAALRGERNGVCLPPHPPRLPPVSPHLAQHRLLLGLGTCTSVLPFPLGVRKSEPSRSSFLLAWSRREKSHIGAEPDPPPSPPTPPRGHQPSPGCHSPGWGGGDLPKGS